MLNFRNTNITFIILLLFIITTIDEFLPWLIVLLLIYLSIIARGVFCISSGFFIKTYCRQKTTTKVIALTFDDGIDNERTPKVLEILKKLNIKAAFFIIGESIQSNNDILIRIISDGHLICNHSQHHSYKLLFKGTQSVREDLLKVNSEVLLRTGKQMKFFRPPFGFINPQIAKVIRNLNLNVIGWSVRTLDTVRKPSVVLNRIRNKLKPGSIILFHDNRQNTTENLTEYISLIKREGYSFERLDKLLGLNAYAE